MRKARSGPRPGPTVTEQFRAAIEASGLTAYALAQLTGIDRGVISHFIAGRRDVRGATLDKLAPHLGIKVTFPARGPRR